MEQKNKKTFKDFMTEDLDVFFNATEFAEEHELDGEQLFCVVVNYNNDNQRNLPREQINTSQDIYKTTKTIYVKESLFYLPKIDSVLTFDGEEFYVDEAHVEDGIIRIVLSANES